jgi:L-arabinose isomerase
MMTIESPKIGLLPLYLKLYDKALPNLRVELEPFLADVSNAFHGRDITVVEAPICRVASEVASAVASFDEEAVDCIVTLHLTYSPSLEAVDCLAASEKPILMLDTTPHRDFGPDVDPLRLLHDHGIHGLQDLASMLRRRGKDFVVVAGHLSDSHTIDRACAVAKGARAARILATMRVLRVGPTFAGMGDFQVPEKVLSKELGIHVEEIAPAALLDAVNAVSDEAIAKEMATDETLFEVDASVEVHERSLRLCLGLRDYLEANAYDAFSMNFLAFDASTGPLSTVPFLECCKAMSRGVGYAGEGDVLTAALVGVLSSVVGPTTFTEMFCPDWDGNTVFMSHMGEFNPAVAAGKARLYEKEFPFTAAQNPVAIACAPQPGTATLVNIAPGPNDTFGLIVAPVTVMGDGTHPDYKDWIRGWIQPAVSLADFLEAYSEHGGTHHCALVYGDCHHTLKAFARFAGLDYVVIGEDS